MRRALSITAPTEIAASTSTPIRIGTSGEEPPLPVDDAEAPAWLVRCAPPALGPAEPSCGLPCDEPLGPPLDAWLPVEYLPEEECEGVEEEPDPPCLEPPLTEEELAGGL